MCWKFSSSPTNNTRLITVGEVTRLHGYKGACVVNVSSGKESALGYLSRVTLMLESGKQLGVIIESALWMPRGWKLSFVGLENKESIQKWVGAKVLADRADLKELFQDEYYVEELVGLEVFDLDKTKKLGKVIGVENYSGGKDRWWIQTDSAQIAVPATSRFVERVDLERRRITVKNLEHL